MMVRDCCAGRDVVLDTNVLIHSTNAASEWQASSVQVLAWLNDCEETLWVLDDQGRRLPTLRRVFCIRSTRITWRPRAYP